MDKCPNCKKTIGDCRVPTTCICSSNDLRRRIAELDIECSQFKEDRANLRIIFQALAQELEQQK